MQARVLWVEGRISPGITVALPLVFGIAVTGPQAEIVRALHRMRALDCVLTGEHAGLFALVCHAAFFAGVLVTLLVALARAATEAAGSQRRTTTIRDGAALIVVEECDCLAAPTARRCCGACC